MLHPVVQQSTMDKIGANVHEIPETPARLSVFRDLDANGQERLKEFSEELYREFVQRVATGRNKSYDEIHAIAQGHVWTGEEALANGLVDAVGWYFLSACQVLLLTHLYRRSQGIYRDCCEPCSGEARREAASEAGSPSVEFIAITASASRL